MSFYKSEIFRNTYNKECLDLNKINFKLRFNKIKIYGYNEIKFNKNLKNIKKYYLENCVLCPSTISSMIQHDYFNSIDIDFTTKVLYNGYCNIYEKIKIRYLIFYLKEHNKNILKYIDFNELSRLKIGDFSYNNHVDNLSEHFDRNRKIKLRHLEVMTYGVSFQDYSIFENLETLNLSCKVVYDVGVEYFADIVKLKKLRSLTMSKICYTILENSFNYINDIENLTYLRLECIQSGCIENVLPVINKNTKLRTLILNNDNKGTFEFKYISELNNLKELHLYFSNIMIGEYDIKKLTKLQKINIRYDNLLQGCYYLLTHRNITDIKMQPINLDLSCTEIKKNNIEKISITSASDSSKIINFIRNSVNITKLCLRHCKLTNISDLKYFTKLIDLDLSKNEIEDITIISNFTNIVKLDLCSNKISNLKPLNKLKKLTSLCISSNKITKIKYLENLPNLEALVIYNNPIKKITKVNKKLTCLTLTSYASLTRINIPERLQVSFYDVVPKNKDRIKDISNIIGLSKYYDCDSIIMLFNYLFYLKDEKIFPAKNKYCKTYFKTVNFGY